MCDTVHNFSAGPAKIPRSVLTKAQEALVDWEGSGVSILSISHRSAGFREVMANFIADLRTLLAIPENYEVLFIHGGASWQFSMVPCNLATQQDEAGYINTGLWSHKGIEEARRFVNVRTLATGHDAILNPSWVNQVRASDAYLHLTANETVDGVAFHDYPDLGDVPLVVDMSSSILSMPVDVSRFGMIYAGGQKNVGPAGFSIVIIRKDLIRPPDESRRLPKLCQYQVYADHESMPNTPPTFSWYVSGLVLQWLLERGGLEAQEARNIRKSETLYDAIDQRDFYINDVPVGCRSRMNVPFQLVDPSLDSKFLSEAKEAGLVGLAGYRTIGGMRASLYNAMEQDGVDALVDFMKHFEQRYG